MGDLHNYRHQTMLEIEQPLLISSQRNSHWWGISDQTVNLIRLRDTATIIIILTWKALSVLTVIGWLNSRLTKIDPL